MKHTIKQLSLLHANEIVKIISDALRDDFPAYKPETIRSYQNDIFNKKYFKQLLKDNKNKVFGTYKDDELIGLVVVKSEFGGVIFIDWLVVKKDHRNVGFGTALLAHVEEWAEKSNVHYVYLMTESNKNIEFYKGRGFYYVGKHTNSWFGEDEFIMGKSYRKTASHL